MGSDLEAGHTSRRRREDYPNTDHGLPFFKWEVLVGPSDWKYHSSGKDGAERYRLHNLPIDGSKPGIYELGVAITSSNDGCVPRKLDEVIPVYIGSASDIRARLQQYGRDGAHLDQAGAGLFTETFEQGDSIVFRWAPMGNLEEAKKVEAELLDKYDYAWNKRGNGPSRRDAVRKRVDDRARCCTRKPPRGTRKGKEQASGKKPLIRGSGGSSSESPPREVEHPHHVVSYVPYRPRRVQEPRSSSPGNGAPKEDGSIMRGDRTVEGTKLSPEHDEEEGTGLPTVVVAPGDHDLKCGAIRGDGSVCESPPEKGCKRCAVHKGRRVNYRSTPPESTDVRIEGGQYSSSFCGVTLGDGSICMQSPVPGRKRCEDHKGRRTSNGASSMGASSDFCRAAPGFFVPSSFCFVTFGDGSFCTQSPVPGRKRCEDHKGRRTSTGASSMGASSDFCRAPGFFVPSSFCGVTLGDGSICMQSPVPGRKRCEDHKGRRTDSGASSKGDSYFWVPGFSESSSVCGATKSNGEPCMAAPVHGRRRCARHKGMRT